MLYIAARNFIAAHVDAHDMLFKITGGYVVKNITKIADQITTKKLSGVGFVQHHPLRIKHKYLMTSCMALSGEKWSSYINYVQRRINELRVIPLEGVYKDFMMMSGAQKGLSLPYPRLEARFGTAGGTTDELRYKMYQKLWAIYAKLGLFALTIGNSNGPI